MEEKDLRSLAQRMKDWLDSPEGRKSADDYFEKLKKKEEVLEKRCERIKTHFSDNQSFDSLMSRILEKQEKYDKRHYYTYTERPLHITDLVWELASSEGTPIEPVDGLTENFPSAIYEYFGYQFAITHGQGSVLSIYKNKECLYRS